MMENDEVKLEWMYKGKQDLLNRDEYLTGRKIDKQFEESTGLSCVESEILPATVGRQQIEIDKNNQVDLLRKEQDDPLVLIRKRELEARRKILENPVKLKKLHEILKNEHDNKSKSKKKKSSKKSSSKKQKRSRSSSSSSSSSSNDSDDLDKILMDKYRKIQGKSSKTNEDSNFIDKKFKALKSELDKIVKKKKSGKREGSHSNSEDDRRDDHKYGEHRETRRYRSRDGYQTQKRRSQTPDKYKRDHDRRNSYSRNKRDHRRELSRTRKSQSPYKKRERSIPKEHNDTEKKLFRNPSPPAQEHTRNNSLSDDDGNVRRKNMTFGLVSAKGDKIEILNKKEVKRYTKEELNVSRKVLEKQDIRKSKKPLSNNEMESKLKEMMANASWREKDREKTVKKYRDDEENENSQHHKEFDKEFMNRNLRHAQQNSGSLEKRIKSNLNNIQRSERTMDSKFC